MRALRLVRYLSGPTIAVGLVGCTVGPDYQSPEVRAEYRRSAPGEEGVPSRTVQGMVDITWWKSFRDIELSSLVERAATQNLDLKTAAERVVQSVAQRRVAVSQALPHIDGQSSTTYNRQSPNGTLSLLTPAPGAPLDYGLFHDGFASSWQLDLFGRVRRAVEAADANTLAAVENRHGVALATITELADSYMLLRGTQNRLGIAKRNLGLAEENVELVNTRFRNGVATTLDMAQARAQQATIAATVPPLRAREARLVNAIGLLLGEPPRALEAELRRVQKIPRVPRNVPVGMPGTSVRSRPDIREAEARLHEATAQTGVAVANFYPDVTLNGAASLESLHLSNLFISDVDRICGGTLVFDPDLRRRSVARRPGFKRSATTGSGHLLSGNGVAGLERGRRRPNGLSRSTGPAHRDRPRRRGKSVRTTSRKATLL